MSINVEIPKHIQIAKEIGFSLQSKLLMEGGYDFLPPHRASSTKYHRHIEITVNQENSLLKKFRSHTSLRN